MGFLSQLSSSLAVLTELTVIRCALALARNHGSAPKVNTDCIAWQVQERIYKREEATREKLESLSRSEREREREIRYGGLHDRAETRGGRFSVLYLCTLLKLAFDVSLLR